MWPDCQMHIYATAPTISQDGSAMAMAVAIPRAACRSSIFRVGQGASADTTGLTEATGKSRVC